MLDETRQMVRCILEGHSFDFNTDLGAVAVGKGAACTPCMDRLFSSQTALQPKGEQPFKRRKPRLIGNK